jgi:hypothetical protein
MSVEGNPDLWSVLFSEELIPDILELVVSAWSTFAMPQANEEEEEITRRFKLALIRTRDQVKLPVTIIREYYEDDPDTGEHLGRIDIRLTSAGRVLETNYFAFECKRLNALVDGKTRALASEYVTKGMYRFIDGQYSRRQRHGGMLGYVLDGRVEHATKLVATNIRGKRKRLCMSEPASLGPSTLRPDRPEARETNHSLDRGAFRLHHLFLSVAQKDHQAGDSGRTRSLAPERTDPAPRP